MLQETFIALLQQYTADKNLIDSLWLEIEKKYSSPKRHYHTLTHLENVLRGLSAVKGELKSWETILFTLFYHDIIYDPLKSTNEEKSAEYAEKRMMQLYVPAETIACCKAQILATKTHTTSTDSDTNYFTDADLSILGKPWEEYFAYSQHVRKEYAIYPDVIYNAGRKKVLLHFLAMNRLFKTDYFHHKFEQQARENMERERTDGVRNY